MKSLCRKCKAPVGDGHCKIAFYPYAGKKDPYEIQLCYKCEMEFRRFINAEGSVGPW
jgi:hypothetical protein